MTAGLFKKPAHDVQAFHQSRTAVRFVFSMAASRITRLALRLLAPRISTSHLCTPGFPEAGFEVTEPVTADAHTRDIFLKRTVPPSSVFWLQLLLKHYSAVSRRYGCTGIYLLWWFRPSASKKGLCFRQEFYLLDLQGKGDFRSFLTARQAKKRPGRTATTASRVDSVFFKITS